MCWPKSLLNLKTLFLGAPEGLEVEEFRSYGELGAEPARFGVLTLPILGVYRKENLTELATTNSSEVYGEEGRVLLQPQLGGASNSYAKVKKYLWVTAYLISSTPP